MYAYCGNDPVMHTDTTGDFFGPIALMTIVVFCIVTSVEIYDTIYQSISEDNLSNNSKIDDTTSTLIEDQGDYDYFDYGFFDVGYNGCEAVAIHNARTLLGEKSMLSDVIYRIQKTGGMVALGLFGSNPNKIGAVLDSYGMTYEKVGLNEMTKPGVYVISYWGEPYENGLRPIHTVTVYYNGTDYGTYNYAPYNCEIGYWPQTHPRFYASDYIVGYYLGGN